MNNVFFRILDLKVQTISKSDELEFTWTSPGDDFDIGKPTSYQLYYSKNPTVSYSRFNNILFILYFHNIQF